MRLTVKLRDGSLLMTEHADIDGPPTKERLEAALEAAKAALGGKTKNATRLGKDGRQRVVVREEE